MPNNCTRKKHPERDAGGASGQSDLPLDATPSSLIKFLVDAKTKLQDDGADHLPILRGIIKNCPAALSGDEAKNFEEAAVDAVFELSKVLLDLVTKKRGPVSQVASLALFNIIPAVVGVRKCVQFLVSSTSAFSNMYTKHWSNGMIHWGKAPNYENMNESTDCFARLQRMHYLMRILNCRKEMLEQQTNMLRDQLKKHQMYLAGPSRARSKRRYHKRDMVSAEDFHEFKTSLKKDPEDLAECLQKMKLDKNGKVCRRPGDSKGPDDGFVVNFKTVSAPDILLDIFESIFEDPYVVIRKEFSWNEENIVPQRYWHSIYLQLHLVHGAMESPSAVEIYADSYEEWSTFGCFFNVIERALLCPATRNHPLALKNLHGWYDMATMYTKTPMKTHNVRLADDVLGGIRRTMFILNSSLWDSITFAKMYQLHILAKQAFANIKNRVKDPNILNFDWTEMLLRELPWKNKRKLQILAELIPHWQDLDIKRIAKKKAGVPGLGTNLVEALEFNELRSASYDVFKAVLDRFTKEQIIRDFVPVIETSLSNKALQPGLANYWLPALIKKYPDVAKNLQVSNLAGSIILLKSERKEGTITLKELLDIQNSYGNSILVAGLQSECVETRSRAISALCQGTNIQVAWLQNVETLNRVTSLVKQFIEDNIVIVSQPCRNIMMKAFASYFSNLRDYLLHVMKVQKAFKFRENPATSSIMESFIWLQKLLYKGMKLGYSYQRNITTLQIYEVLLNAFLPAEKNLQIRTSKLVALLKSEESFAFHSEEMFKATLKCILSPAEDVRILSSNIILGNPTFDTSGIKFDDISEEALMLCSGQKFYVVEAGALLYKTVAELSNIPEQVPLQFLSNQAKAEFDVLKVDLLKGAMEKRPVYGCLQAIIFILHNKSVVSSESLNKVLSLVEEVTDHFLGVLTSKSSTQEFAPSFEDMDWAIESEINENYSLDNKTLHLSPQFQYALNCAWLNLKTCTELACCLGNHFATNKYPDEQVWRCSVVIMNVLQKCRHKGAFEAAGVAMGSFVKTISSQGSNIPERMLNKLLSTLNRSGSDAPPISRRSAGLAVAIHKIVVSDSNPEKELLHDTFEQLLSPTEESADESKEKRSGLVDDIKTRKMHVLYTLISDSGIGQHVNCHLESVGQMAIYYLNADDWGVKNAAMQLFGAFVKKIATQKKSKSVEEMDFDGDTDWDITGNGLLEDVLIRSSYLVSQIVAIIRYPPPEKDDSQCAQMAPCCNPPDENAISCALGFLQCLTPGPPSLWTEAQGTLVNDIRYYCWQLMGHPSWLVRKQAAKSSVTFVNRFYLGSTLKNLSDEIDNASANKLHGLMMMVTIIKKRINFFREDKKKVEGVLKDIELKITAKLLVDLADKTQRSSFLSYKFAAFEDLKKEEITNILFSIAQTSDLMQVKNYCQVLFASELVEQVVRQQQDWIPEILALCSSFESLSCVQEHLLLCLLKSGEVTPATEEQLEIALQYKLKQHSCKHELVSLMKVLVLRKNKTRQEIVSRLGDKSIWEFNSCSLELDLKPNIEICSELIKFLTNHELLGDEFEGLALSVIAYTIIECITSGNVEDSCQFLPTLTRLLASYLSNNNVPELAIIGPALFIISPVTWELLRALPNCQYLKNVGIEIFKVTIALLLEQDCNAAKSFWPLRSPQSHICELNPNICLRMMNQLAVGTLVTSENMEQYLWDTLKTNFDSQEDRGVSSPFSHSGEVDLDFFEFIKSGFESIYNFTNSSMTRNCMPSSSQVEGDLKSLVHFLQKFRESTNGELQQLHPRLAVAMRKLCLTIFALDKFYDQREQDQLNTSLDGQTVKRRIDFLSF